MAYIIGPTFWKELSDANVSEYVGGWGSDGTGIIYRNNPSAENIATINAVIAAHNPLASDIRKDALDALQSMYLIGYGKLIKQIVQKLNAARTAGVAIPAWDASAVALYNELQTNIDLLNGK